MIKRFFSYARANACGISLRFGIAGKQIKPWTPLRRVTVT